MNTFLDVLVFVGILLAIGMVFLVIVTLKARKKIDARMRAQEVAKHVDAHTAAYARNRTQRTAGGASLQYPSTASACYPASKPSPRPRPTSKLSGRDDEDYSSGFVAADPVWYSEPTSSNNSGYSSGSSSSSSDSGSSSSFSSSSSSDSGSSGGGGCD